MTRKIDMMVAKEVFGVGIKVIEESGWETVYLDEKTELSIPRYSTDIAEAWKIVELLRLDGWNITLYANKPPNSSGCVMHKLSNHSSCIDANTLLEIPRAIAIAALKAKGVSQQLIDEAMK